MTAAFDWQNPGYAVFSTEGDFFGASNVSVTVPEPVPEPSSGSLLALGLLGRALAGRRR